MKRMLLGGLAAGLLLAASPMASADPGDSLDGGCFFATGNNARLTGGHHQGFLGLISVTTDGQGHPTGAYVDCVIQVNGNDAAEGHFGNGVDPTEAGLKPITFNTVPRDIITLCTTIHFADQDTPHRTCAEVTVTANGAVTIAPDALRDTLPSIAYPISKSSSGRHRGAMATDRSLRDDCPL